jgi:hypothetical protein
MKKNEGVGPKRSLEWVFTLLLFSVVFSFSWGTHGYAASDDALVIDEQGNAKINGTLTSQGRHQENDDPEKAYEISPRYHLTLTALSSDVRQKMIPQEIFEALCADVDGCQVRLGRRASSSGTNADADTESRSSLLYYSKENRHYRASHAQKLSENEKEFSQGVDNNNRQGIVAILGFCFFVDGQFNSRGSIEDKEVGMFLAVLHTPNHLTCELTLID